MIRGDPRIDRQIMINNLPLTLAEISKYITFLIIIDVPIGIKSKTELLINIAKNIINLYPAVH